MIVIFRAAAGVGKTTASNFLLTGSHTSSERTAYDEHVRSKLEYSALLAELQLLRTRLEGRDIVRGSSDDYFTGPDGVYNFDPAGLSASHGLCMRKVVEAVQRSYVDPGKHAVIVDNTNCSIAEVAPYCQLANAYQQELHVLTLLGDVREAWRRNVHEVPMTHVIKQDLTLRESVLQWPPWWPQKIFVL